MADIALTAAQIAPVYPDKAEIFDGIAAVALTAGQSVYINSSGKLDLADGNVTAAQQIRGIVLKSVGANQAVSVLKKGHVFGFTVSGLAYDAALFQGDTAGVLNDTASATKTINVGRVAAIPDGSLTKVVWFEADWLRTW